MSALLKLRTRYPDYIARHDRANFKSAESWGIPNDYAAGSVARYLGDEETVVWESNGLALTEVRQGNKHALRFVALTLPQDGFKYTGGAGGDRDCQYSTWVSMSSKRYAQMLPRFVAIAEKLAALRADGWTLVVESYALGFAFKASHCHLLKQIPAGSKLRTVNYMTKQYLRWLDRALVFNQEQHAGAVCTAQQAQELTDWFNQPSAKP